MDANAEQLFRKLLEPITAIGELFQINLSTILDPFLERLEDVLCKVKEGNNQEEKEIDFVRAGYLITNATLLYSAKVDCLYKEVYDLIDKLKSGTINQEEDNEQTDPERDLELRLSNNKNPFVLLPIYGLKKGPKASRFSEFDPQPIDVFAKTQVSFMSMSEAEKRRVNLLSSHNKSIIIGCKDDFLLNTCSFLDNGTAILDYEFLDIIDVIIPPRNIVTIDELPPTIPEEMEAPSSRGQCFNPNQLEDQLVRGLEKKFCQQGNESEVMVEYSYPDEGMEVEDYCPGDGDAISSNRLIENMREGSCQPSRMGNYDISDVMPSSQHNTSRRVLSEIQQGESFVGRDNYRSEKPVVKLEAIVEEIKEHVEFEDTEDIDHIKCRSFKDAYTVDNFLSSGESKRSKNVMVSVTSQKKFLDYDKILKERNRKIRHALEKQGKTRKSLSYCEILEYIRMNGNGRLGTTSVEASLFDEDKIYNVCLHDEKGTVRLLRKKVLKECEKNMNAATNIPETVVECMDDVEVNEYEGNDQPVGDDDECIPTMEDNGIETLPIVDEHLLTQEDFDLVQVPEIEAINNAMNMSRKRTSLIYDEEIGSRGDQICSQTGGLLQRKGGQLRNLEAYLNDTVVIGADEELPSLNYAEIIEKYNDKYWKNIDREVGKTYEKVIEWDDFLKPHIKIEEERKHFDISEYGHNLIDKFNDIGEEINFSDMVKSCPRHMISRYFLSSLLLVNKGNFQTNKGGGINSISYKLIKKHFDASEE
uniref:Condensin-2 complex subunit H2 n=1 Tax=Strongyloides stercoralis TaxID=6248 RepID=A0A0K0DSR4_STRER